MNVVRIADFAGHVGTEVQVQGWLHNKRSSGKLQFLIVRDGSGFAQAVMAKAAVSPEAWAAAEAAGQESSLELTGKVKFISKQLLHLEALAGREFFDALIDISKIEAVIVRTR